MRRTITIAMCTTIFCGISLAEGENPGKKFVEQRTAEMGTPDMEAWVKANEPGLAHEFLVDAFVGEWDVKSKIWMDPSAPPMESSAHAIVEPFLGGRFIHELFSGTMMGMPFEGHSLTGYDNTTKMFNSFWVDSMSTGMGPSTGSIDDTGTELTFIGEMNEPTTGEIGKHYMIKVKIVDEDTHITSMHEVLYGEPFKVMELVYTRVGDKAAMGH